MMHPPSDDDASSFSSLEGVSPPKPKPTAAAAVSSMMPTANETSSDSSVDDGAAPLAAAVPAAAGVTTTTSAGGQGARGDSPPSRDFSPVGGDGDEDEIHIDIDDLCPPEAFTGGAAAPRPKFASTTGLGGDTDSEEDASFNVASQPGAAQQQPQLSQPPQAPQANAVTQLGGSVKSPAVSTATAPPPQPTTRLVATPTGPLAAAVVRRTSPVPQPQPAPPPVPPQVVTPAAAAVPAQAAPARASSPPPPPLHSIIATSPIKPSLAAVAVGAPQSPEKELPPQSSSSPAPSAVIASSPTAQRPTAFATEPQQTVSVGAGAKSSSVTQPLTSQPTPSSLAATTSGPTIGAVSAAPAQNTGADAAATPRPPAPVNAGSPQVPPPAARPAAAVAAAPPPPPPPPPAAAAAVDEWDQATREFEAAQAAAANAPRAVPLLNITWDEAYREIRKQTHTWQKFVTADLKRVSDRAKTKGFWGACWSCWHHDITEGGPLYDERDFVLALRQMPLDHSNEVHRRVLITCWRTLTKPARNATDPPTTGPAWQALGFQGDNPATDLRANGMFGLLQLLFLVDHVRMLGETMFEVASSRLLEFPIAIVSFNFTAIATQCLLDRLLHDTIVSRFNKKQADAPAFERRMKLDGGSTEVAMVCNELYVGCMYRFFETWQQETQRRITDFDPIRRSLAERAADKTSALLAAFQLAKTEYSREGIRSKREATLKARLDPILDKGPSRFTDF